MSDNVVSVSTVIDENMVAIKRETKKGWRRLSYFNEKCIGCGMCIKACPRNAINSGPVGAINKGSIDSQKIIIDQEECILCGICSGVCLFGALDLEIDGKSIKDTGDYLSYEKVYIFNETKCETKEGGELCDYCENVCKRGAIKAKMVTVKDKNKDNKKTRKNTIERDESLCIFCSSCENACPKDAIKVGKIFDGDVDVDLEKCQGCGVCCEVCPSGAISMPVIETVGDKPDKIAVNTDICAFCGACEHVCPVDAISVKRSRINYIKGKDMSWTGRWETAFQKLKDY